MHTLLHNLEPSEARAPSTKLNDGAGGWDGARSDDGGDGLNGDHVHLDGNAVWKILSSEDVLSVALAQGKELFIFCFKIREEEVEKLNSNLGKSSDRKEAPSPKLSQENWERTFLEREDGCVRTQKEDQDQVCVTCPFPLINNSFAQ